MRRGRGLTIGLTVAATILVLALGLVGYVYSGWYDVAATTGHTGLVSWALETVQERSVEARAGDVGERPVADSAALAHGFDHFHAMCVQCHGAPGIERGELGQGLTPSPPELSEEAAEYSPAELFWITKHGIKLAGMPAFGPTHSDEDLWGIVAFVEQLSDMSAAEYAQWVARSDSARAGAGDAGGAGGGHTHAPGTPAHEH